MAHAVTATSIVAALAPAAGSLTSVAQRKTLSLRTVPCAAVSRRSAISASLAPIEKEAEEILSNVDNQKAAAATMAGSLFAFLSNVDSAAAAQEIVSIADADNRGLSLLVILLPALGWVLFNILRPALNQLNKMQGKKGLVGAVGLGAAASLLAAPDAEAAQQIADLAADNRAGALLLVLAPALGWVLFNILGPAKNQLNKMTGKKGLVGAVGLGAAASLLAAPDAEAAQQIADLAADNRAGALLLVLAPALGWVLFNILGPAKNQLTKMTGKKGLIGAAGLGAASALLAAAPAEAAQEIAQLADDSRPALLLLVLGPALGWVGYNIFKPALNQLDKMKQ